MILEPPAIYDYPHPGAVTVWEKSAADVQTLCRNAGHRGGFFMYGCVFEVGDARYTIIIKDLPPEIDRLVRRHENAHHNGWRHR